MNLLAHLIRAVGLQRREYEFDPRSRQLLYRDLEQNPSPKIALQYYCICASESCTRLSFVKTQQHRTISKVLLYCIVFCLLNWAPFSSLPCRTDMALRKFSID